MQIFEYRLLKGKLVERFGPRWVAWLKWLFLLSIPALIISLFPMVLFPVGLVSLLIRFSPLYMVFLYFPLFVLYASVWTVFMLAFIRMGFLRWLAAPALTGLLAFAIPYSINQAIYLRIDQLTKDDIALEKPLGFIDTISIPAEKDRFVSPRRVIHGNSIILRSEFEDAPVENICGVLCQKLLFNGAAKYVVVGVPSATDPDAGRRFSIDKRDICPEIPHNPNRFGPINLLPRVLRRIEAGECLVYDTLSPVDADMVTYTRTRFFEFDRHGRAEARAADIQVERAEVVRRHQGKDEVIFRQTAITAYPLRMPFMIGRANFQGSTWIKVSKHTVNTFREHEGAPESNIFEKYALAIPAAVPFTYGPRPVNIVTIVKEHPIVMPDKQDEPISPERFLKRFAAIQGKPTKADIDMVTQALADDRITDWPHLATFTRQFEVRNASSSLVVALGDRLVRNKGEADIAKAIRSLPPGAAAPIYPQLYQVMLDKEMSNKAWQAVVRLADSKSPEAVLAYTHVLDIWQKTLVAPDTGNKQAELQDITNVTKGSLLGLCKMNNPMQTRDLLFSMVTPEQQDHVITRMAIGNLVRMGQTNVLRWQYRHNAALLRVIENEALKLLTIDMQKNEFCDMLER